MRYNDADRSYYMKSVSRKKMKLPAIIDAVEGNRNSPIDIASVKQAFATSKRKKYKISKEIAYLKAKDVEFDIITKIPEDSSDMVVITKAKKLTAYITAVTGKSPKIFRATYVNRLQNYALDCIENLFEANFIKLDTNEHIAQREAFQSKAIVRLKMVAYTALIAETAGCILPRQYRQISLMVGECINLAVNWMKSDVKRVNANRYLS